MMSRWQGISLPALLLALFVPFTHVHAQATVTPEDEYKKLIRVNEEVQPLGEHPFGENISLYDGSLSFRQTDVSISGNGPLMQLSRVFRIDGEGGPGRLLAQHTFGDWRIELPHLETLTGMGYTYNSGSGWHAVTGWEVSVAPNVDPNTRCTNFGLPPTISQHIGDSALVAWGPEAWWKGYQLVMPGQGSEDLLVNPNATTKSTYPVVTKSQWRVSCLSSTANGQPGEGFLAQSPDGTKYWFNHLVYQTQESISRPLYQDDITDASKPRGSFLENLIASHADPVAELLGLFSGSSPAHAAPVSNTLGRKKALMLVTRIEDRFGNALTFSYDTAGNLTGIVASDGRKLTVQYVSGTARIHSVTLQPSSGAARTWTYAYNTGGTSLIGVTLPDGTQWQYGLANFSAAGLSPSPGISSCLTVGVPSLSAVTGTVTHPSGLVGTFTVKPMRHGRSYVPQDCRGVQNNNPATQGSYAVIPSAWYGFSITKRVLSGAAIPTSTWLYNYSPANDSWYDCGTNCATTVYSDVVSPDGSTVRSTFSNKYDHTESQLLRIDYYSGTAGSSTLMRSEVSSYAAPTTAPLPQNVGYNLQSNVNSQQTDKYSPLNKRVITQDGTAYTWQATAFNAYAQVTKTKRFSNISGQPAIEEQTTYLNDVTHWSLGLPTETKNLTYNEVVDEYVYDMAKVTLKERWRFGQKLMSYTFNSAGQLATFTDGNSHTTTLSNYKRGIPQTIKTPDNKTQTLVVDDFGQITSITDQAGSKTSYTYDLSGRVTGISYPTGDEQAWLPKTFAYAYVTGAERGLAAKHWRRIVSQGNSRAVTYFDALMRPVLSDSYINGVSGSNTTVLTNYDTKGQTVFASYPEATARNFTNTPGSIKGTTSTYDALGRLTKTQQGSELGTLTTTISYLSGARKQVTDPRSYVTTTSYQVFDQPSYDAVIKVVAPAGVTQTITRDLYGNPTIINQSGTYGTTSLSFNKSFVYDSYYRLCRTIEPESLSTVMAYDAANNLAWSAAGLTITGSGCGQEQVTAAAKTTRTYDAMNRLKTILPPAGTQSTSYTYDALGNPTAASSGISTWSATYNKRGMLTGESLLLNTQGTWALGYVHDTYGHLSLIQYPDGESVSYAPDALGRPTKVGSYLTSISYFPSGEVEQATLGNGALYVAEQNDRQLQSNFSYAKGSTINLSEDVTYDKNGNITQFADLAGGTRDKTFGYDALNRLTSATATALWGTETYAYDPINNLRKRVNGSQTTTYNYDTRNRLGSLSGTGATTFGYDERGNVTSKGGVALNFDQKNQLTSLPGVSYAYDAAGRRVSKTPSSGSPTYSFYNQAGQLMYQVEPGLGKTTSYAYLGRKLVGSNESTIPELPSAPASAPTLTTPTSSATGGYTVSWNAVSGATSYTLQEQVGTGGWGTIQTSSATNKTISGKGNGTYGYKVRACNAEGCSAWSSTKTTVVLLKPATPASISVPATSTGSIAVGWAASSTATSYTLQQRLGTGSWSSVYTGSATSSTRVVTASGSYTYQVRACNASGCSAYKGSSAVAVTVAPASAPTLTVPGSSNTGSYTTSWTAVTGATSYTLQEKIGSGSWATIQTSSARSKAISGKGNGSYGYRVQACNAGGCGGWSSTKTITVALVPTVPTGMQTVQYTINAKMEGYKAQWSSVSGATSYDVRRAGTTTNLYHGPSTSFIIVEGLAPIDPGEVYDVQVRACNAVGCSGWTP